MRKIRKKDDLLAVMRKNEAFISWMFEDERFAMFKSCQLSNDAIKEQYTSERVSDLIYQAQLNSVPDIHQTLDFTW